MISGTLEYLMSSLPNLSFQNTEEIKNDILGLLKKYGSFGGGKLSPIEILDREAHKYLTASSFHIFQKINLKNIHEPAMQKNKSKVLSAFAKFSFQLKNEIKKWRTSPEEGNNAITKKRLDNIMGEGTPLEKEIQLMHYQWEKLEELSSGHFADFEALVTYKIKLVILLRWWSFDTNKGFKKFMRLTLNN